MPTALEMLCNHIAVEENASRVYLYFQRWCGLSGWDGSAKFFREEAHEELHHMRWITDYVIDRWEGIDPPPIAPQPAIDIRPSRLIELFAASLEIERAELAGFNAIWTTAMGEGDTDTARFIKKYTKLGVKSIRKYETFVQQLSLAGGDPASLLFFDKKII